MWYLKSAFDAYQMVQDAVQGRLGEVQSAILSPMEMMQGCLQSSRRSGFHHRTLAVGTEVGNVKRFDFRHQW
jgi:hypothetical protein